MQFIPFSYYYPQPQGQCYMFQDPRHSSPYHQQYAYRRSRPSQYDAELLNYLAQQQRQRQLQEEYNRQLLEEYNEALRDRQRHEQSTHRHRRAQQQSAPAGPEFRFIPIEPRHVPATPRYVVEGGPVAREAEHEQEPNESKASQKLHRRHKKHRHHKRGKLTEAESSKDIGNVVEGQQKVEQRAPAQTQPRPESTEDEYQDPLLDIIEALFGGIRPARKESDRANYTYGGTNPKASAELSESEEVGRPQYKRTKIPVEHEEDEEFEEAPQPEEEEEEEELPQAEGPSVDEIDSQLKDIGALFDRCEMTYDRLAISSSKLSSLTLESLTSRILILHQTQLQLEDLVRRLDLLGDVPDECKKSKHDLVSNVVSVADKLETLIHSLNEKRATLKAEQELKRKQAEEAAAESSGTDAYSESESEIDSEMSEATPSPSISPRPLRKVLIEEVPDDSDF